MQLEIIENDVVMFGVDSDETKLPDGVEMTSPGGMRFIVSTTDNGFKIELLGKKQKEK